MKARYKIIILILIIWIPVSLFFPDIFLIFHLDKFETNNKCEKLNGNWDWVNNICELQHNGISDPDLMCIDAGGTPTCATTCGSYNVFNPWSLVLPLGCLDYCKFACEFENEK
ncbi:hypothetical protein [Nitrosopumilus ureiphilus]|uniref:Transmembrane protein n=1 Tax=Nitrosopumilus ureiphilus TaxID=1470067 RepID=A0A7D5M4Q4_9ARCH|nr:hypothetical protein [Nitrosopumilus ureiphilus]QLH06493.1 hypothetical protein C5F50_04965 [Nitrosopumilus ureiphilus]